MKFEVVLENHYPHPVEDVWAGLTSADALGEWLMETRNFVAEVGCRFEMVCLDDAGHQDIYHCEVLEVEPPHRMRWTWVLGGNEGKGVTQVEFQLTETDDGTRLTLRHRGDRDREMLERFKAGWPHRLEKLAGLLDRRPGRDSGDSGSVNRR